LSRFLACSWGQHMPGRTDEGGTWRRTHSLIIVGAGGLDVEIGGFFVFFCLVAEPLPEDSFGREGLLCLCSSGSAVVS
jgi:hypothetical protein